MVVQFSDHGATGLLQALEEATLQRQLCYRQDFRAFCHLRTLEFINIKTNVPPLKLNWHFISSFTFMERREEEPEESLTLHSSTYLITTLRIILRKLNFQTLTSLRLRSARPLTRLVLPAEAHFLTLASLDLEGFQLDSIILPWETSEVNLTDFIINHRTSLQSVILMDCTVITTDLELDAEERLQLWIQELNIAARVQLER